MMYWGQLTLLEAPRLVVARVSLAPDHDVRPPRRALVAARVPVEPRVWDERPTHPASLRSARTTTQDVQQEVKGAHLKVD